MANWFLFFYSGRRKNEKFAVWNFVWFTLTPPGVDGFASVTVITGCDVGGGFVLPTAGIFVSFFLTGRLWSLVEHPKYLFEVERQIQNGFHLMWYGTCSVYVKKQTLADGDMKERVRAEGERLCGVQFGLPRSRKFINKTTGSHHRHHRWLRRQTARNHIGGYGRKEKRSDEKWKK